jgi:predicted ester cyclase
MTDERRATGDRPPATNEELRAARERIVRTHMESENVHDFHTTLATFSHPRYEIIPTGAVHDGPEEVMQYFRDSRAAFPDQRNELIALHHMEDGVAVEFWLRGTHKGPLMGFEPTGKSFECRVLALFLFEGSAIVCERVYFDSATILRQLTA